jgi:peptidoglycan/LPS O-acetylase OafA/YrhL
VDYARLGLALSVCLFHTEKQYHFWPTNYGLAWAVPGFLSISGFYVLRSYEQSRTWVEFIKKRVLRIVPAFTVSLVMVGFLGGLVLIEHVLVYYVTLGIKREGTFVNGPVWSLGAEEIAYAVLAILFALGAYRKKWPIWVAFIASMLWEQVLPHITDSDPILTLFTIVPAFFAGSLIYIYRDKILGKDWRGFALILAAVLLPALIVSPNANHPVGFVAYFPGVLMGVGILLVRKFKMPKIPDFSYGIYVYHLPLLWMVHGPPAHYFGWFALLLPASWYLIEKPALSFKNRRRSRAAAPSPQPAES